MVGRLVEQEQVGLAGQRPGQERAPLQAPGKFLKAGVRREPHMGDEVLHPHIAFPILLMMVVVGPQAGIDQIVDRAGEPLGDLLRQPGIDRPVGPENIARVGLHLAGDDPHQGGLARAVAPEQAHALARIHLKVQVLQDRGTTEAEIDVEQAEQRHKRSNVNRRHPPWQALRPELCHIETLIGEYP